METGKCQTDALAQSISEGIYKGPPVPIRQRSGRVGYFCLERLNESSS